MNILSTITDNLSAFCSRVNDYFTGDVITSRKHIAGLTALFTLLGITLGFLCAPIKKGVYINISNNGNNNGNNNSADSIDTDN